MWPFKKKVKLIDTSESKKSEAISIFEDETDIKELYKENKKFWFFIATACITVLGIILVSCIISIFKNVYDVNVYLGYFVLALIIILLLIFILIPVIKALSSPTFKLDATVPKDKISNIVYRKMKRVAKNLTKDGNNSLDEKMKNKLKNSMNNRNDLKEVLNECYKDYISKDITKIIWSTSFMVGASTGISKNSNFDMISIGICNIRMIMKIAVKCGYRPSYTALAKLIVKVFRNALIGYGVSTLSLGEKFAKWISKLIPELLPGKQIIADFTEGAANAILTARIGVLTKKYLYSEFSSSVKKINLEEQNIITEEAEKIADNLGTEK